MTLLGPNRTFLSRHTMIHISLLAYPDCAASGIFGTIDAFLMANNWHRILNQHTDLPDRLFEWDILTIDGRPIQGDGQVTIVPHRSIEEVKTTDLIFIPGFIPPFRFLGSVPSKLTDWLNCHHESNAIICSTCTGTFLLAEAGLLDTQTVTTNPLFARYFKKLYPSIKLEDDQILTEDDGIICSGATTSFLDLCLYLIEKFGYEELAAVCTKALLKEPRVSQTPYSIFNYHRDHLDDTVKEAQYYLEKNFSRPIPVEDLAVRFGISPRHFVRRFKTATGDSPLQYLQRIRIETAKQKLEKTRQPITEITRHIGYEDPNSFRKLFKKNTGLSPREYRNRFSRDLRPIPIS